MSPRMDRVGVSVVVGLQPRLCSDERSNPLGKCGVSWLELCPMPMRVLLQLFEAEGPKRLLVVWWRGVRGNGFGMLYCFGGRGNTDW